MRHLTVVSSDELIDSLHTQVITNTISSAMRSIISWRIKVVLLLFITFRTNIRMSIIYFSPCLFLFALHLDWYLNTSVDRKIKRSFYICEIAFHFRLWLKVSIFFSLVLRSLQMHNRSGKKLNRKKLNVDRQFIQDVICVTLLQEGVGQYQFLGKIDTHFPHFHLLTLPLKWRFLYIPPTCFYYNPGPCPPTVLLINNIYSWKSKLKHTGVDIKCFFVYKIFVNKTWKIFIESPLYNQWNIIAYENRYVTQH